MTNAAYELAIDLGDDGVFTDTGDDVTSQVIPSGGSLVYVERGRDQVRLLAPPRAGSGSFTLNNESGEYSPGTDLTAGRQVRLRASHSGQTYDLHRGIVDLPSAMSVGDFRKRVGVRTFGTLSRLAGKRVSSALYADVTTDVALRHLLDAAGWPAEYDEVVLADAPVVFFRCQEASGSTMTDSSGNGHDGTWVDSPTFQAAPITDQDGDHSVGITWAGGEYGDFTSSIGSLPSGANPRTIECWFTPATVNGGWFWALSYGAPYAGASMFLGRNGTTLYFGGYGDDLTADLLQAGEKYHIVGTYDGVTAQLWVNGEKVAEASKSWSTDISGGASAIASVGRQTNTFEHWDGSVSHVAIYDQALSPSRIKAHYAAGNDSPRHIDDGKTTMDWWWLDDEDAFGAMNSLLATEGPGAAIYEDGTGAIVFKNRHARITEARSTDVQTTFRSSGAEPLLDLPFSYDAGLRDVVNVCELSVVSRAAQTSAQFWALGSSIVMTPNETRRFVARHVDGEPFTAVIAPSTGDGDYTVAAGALASPPTLDRTSGASATVTLIAGPSGATITGLRLRGQLVPAIGVTAVANTIDTAVSQARFGRRTYRYAPRAEISVGAAQDFANAVVGFYQEGRPSATVTIVANGDTSRMTAALAREIGDRIRVIESNVPIDTEYTVEQIRHEVRAPATHVTTLGVEESITGNTGVWDSGRFDNAIWGW